MMWYLSVYQQKEIESSLFSHISCLCLSLSPSFCFSLSLRGGRFYWALEDSLKQWPGIWSFCANTGSASERSHTHHSRGFIPFPIVPISSDSGCQSTDQETERTALLLLISPQPIARRKRLTWLQQQNVKCSGWHFKQPSHFQRKVWLMSEEVLSTGQFKFRGSTCTKATVVRPLH